VASISSRWISTAPAGGGELHGIVQNEISSVADHDPQPESGVLRRPDLRAATSLAIRRERIAN
jgi:hypothetical protein